jgi:hypothetical protein
MLADRELLAVYGRLDLEVLRVELDDLYLLITDVCKFSLAVLQDCNF